MLFPWLQKSLSIFVELLVRICIGAKRCTPWTSANGAMCPTRRAGKGVEETCRSAVAAHADHISCGRSRFPTLTGLSLPRVSGPVRAD